MSNNTFNIATERQAHEAAQSAMQSRKNAAAEPYFTPKAEVAQRHSVTVNDGKITLTDAATRHHEHGTIYASPSRPGFITVPGMGETTVEAAKASGLIPHTWQEGQPLPFETPAKDPEKGTEAGTEDKAAKKDLSVAEHQAKIAGDILDTVDRQYGSAVTDHYIDQVVSTGELPEDGLPPTVTATMVKQVMQGYIAQADAVLTPVGASVPMLQEMLSDEELHQARSYTLTKATDGLAELGRVAVDRLSMLPQTDPESFLDMLSEMPQQERQCIRQDPKTGKYLVAVPGHPEMEFAAAVRIGLVRV